jgi:hypothetical protein
MNRLIVAKPKIDPAPTRMLISGRKDTALVCAYLTWNCAKGILL